jgi:hypothetical protein
MRLGSNTLFPVHIHIGTTLLVGVAVLHHLIELAVAVMDITRLEVGIFHQFKQEIELEKGLVNLAQSDHVTLAICMEFFASVRGAAQPYECLWQSPPEPIWPASVQSGKNRRRTASWRR